MRIIFIRHGKTFGNTQHRYIGRTDEPLCSEGASEISAKSYPSADFLIVSPMKRCIETAKLIYPQLTYTVENDFRECDFGDFEGKNHLELNCNANYQRWIDSGGTLPFPNGESREKFSKRCCDAFEQIKFDENKTPALIVHGGTIMAILEKYAYPKKDYYDYQVKNGCGFIGEYNDGSVYNLSTL